MNKPTSKQNSAPSAAPGTQRQASPLPQQDERPRKKAGKFAVGYYFGERGGFTFHDLAEEFAPRLKEVYFPWVGLAHGRTPARLMPDGEEHLIDDLQYCRKHGMKLDLLANAMCYGEKSFTEEQRKQLADIIRRLDGLGLYPEIVTTTSPYVAKVFKRDYPDIEVRASVNMELRNTIAFEYLAPLFDSFYICRSVQRDLPTFRRIADWCKDHGKKLCMLVNSGCVRNCPWHIVHDARVSHDMQSEIYHELANQGLDILCNQLFGQRRRLTEFLRCGWIRPEDVHVFEPDLETIKLSTRRTDYAHEIVEAYLNGSYDGNLLRLMDPYHGFGFRPHRVDNKSFPKDWITSGIAGKCADNCIHCGKCEKLLEQLLKYDIDENTRAADFAVSDRLVYLAPKRRISDQFSFKQKTK